MKIFLSGILTIIVFPLSAQTAVELPKMNVLFVGVDNLLTIVLEDTLLKAVQVRVSTGEVLPDSTPGHYHRRICRADSTHARLFVEDTLMGTRLAVRDFRVKTIGDGQIDFLYSPPRGYLVNNKLQPVAGIAAVFGDFPYDVYCEVVRYTVELKLPGESPAVYKNEGNRFSAELVARLRGLPAGARVITHDIEYRCGCNSEIYVSDAPLRHTIR